MEDTKKMLRAILNGQSAMKQELLIEIRKNTEKIERLDEKMDVGFIKVNERLDKQGKPLAYLEDDAPTIKEFDKLEKRVSKVEYQLASL